jgi:hypothetical protein
VIKKEGSNILKRTDLTREMQPTWKANTNVRPIRIGAIGTVSIKSSKFLNNIPGKHNIKLTTENSNSGYRAHTSGCTGCQT